MRYALYALLLILSLLTVSPSTAQAGTFSLKDSFTLTVEPFDGGKRVAVRFNHPQFGWVDAGYVDFRDDGGVVLKIRGEDPEEITNLGDRLSSFSEKKIGDPSIGLQLAMNIEGAAAGM